MLCRWMLELTEYQLIIISVKLSISLESSRDLHTHVLGMTVSTVLGGGGTWLYYRKCQAVTL